MRAFLLLLAAWLAFAVPAEAGPAPQRASSGSGVVASVPTGPAPQAATFLGYDQMANLAGTNNGISIAALGTAVPTPNVSAWVWVQKFRYDDQAGNTVAGTSGATLAAACATSACTGGSDRQLTVTNPFSTATRSKQREVSFAAKRSNAVLWTTPCGASCASTGINLVAGTSYCLVIAQYPAGQMSISVNDATGAPASGSPAVQTTANNTSSPGAANFYYAAGSGTPSVQSNLFNTLGTTTTTTSSYQKGTGGPLGDVALLTGTLANTSGTPDAVALQNLCNGKQDINTWAAAQGLGVKTHYTLANPDAVPPTSFAADPAGTFTTAATVFGGDTTKIIPASPINPLLCLLLNEKGPYDVAPLDAGQSGSGVGTVMVSGTVNTTSCGFAPSAVDAEVLNIGTGAVEVGWTTIPVTAGAYKGYVLGVPGSITAVGCHRVSVRLHEAPAYVLTGRYPLCVGYSYLRVGQSQVSFMMNPGDAGGTGSRLVGNGTVSVISMPAVDSGDVLSNQGEGQPSMTVISAQNNPGGNSPSQTVGDGIAEEAQDLAADLGVPIKVVSVARGGMASDAWAEDYQPQSAALTGSGTGTYSSATIFTAAVATGAGGANATFLGTNFNGAGGTIMTALKGSVRLLDTNGTTVASDNGAGIFTGPQVSAAGTINYLTGAIAGLTFTASQASPLTAKWTAIQDAVGGNYAQQSPYVGFPVFGDAVHSNTGFSTQVLNQVYQPFNAILFEQCTTDGAAMSSTNPPPTNASGYPLSWQTKWDYVLNSPTGKFAKFGWYRPGTPIMVLGYARDTNDARGNVSGCRQGLIAMANQGAPYFYGGTYIDDLTQCGGSTVLCLSPHEGPWVAGGRRLGRRAESIMLNKQLGTMANVAEDTITGAARSGTTVTFTVTMPHGGALTNCGASLSGGSNAFPTSGTNCVPPGTPVSTPVYGMIFGTTTLDMFDSSGFNARSSSVDDTKQSSCQIASANTFTCTGTWFANGLLWAYGADRPIGLAGTIPPLTVVTGSGYTGAGSNSVTGTGAANATGGTCVHATASIHQSGGFVTASRVTPGSQCVGTDTFALTGLSVGSGGSVSATYWQPLDDANQVGQLLYDDQLGCGAVRSATTFEPGCPVTPVVIPQGPLA